MGGAVLERERAHARRFPCGCREVRAIDGKSVLVPEFAAGGSLTL
jgi:hypothetical protein